MTFNSPHAAFSKNKLPVSSSVDTSTTGFCYVQNKRPSFDAFKTSSTFLSTARVFSLRLLMITIFWASIFQHQADRLPLSNRSNPGNFVTLPAQGLGPRELQVSFLVKLSLYSLRGRPLPGELKFSNLENSTFNKVSRGELCSKTLTNSMSACFFQRTFDQCIFVLRTVPPLKTARNKFKALPLFGSSCELFTL